MASAETGEEPTPVVEVPPCPICGKPPILCICESVTPVENRTEVLILQHPQEQDKLLGTARLTAHHLTRATFKVGLSWASLEKALGRPADPRRWAVLYLGAEGTAVAPGREVSVLDAKGELLPEQDKALAGLSGVILLDGTWSQAKTLWWRNPWVLKTRRIVLSPGTPSLYGRLRREPRREGLSTIEAAAVLLSRIERKPEIQTALTDTFARMLERYRAADIKAPAPKLDRRARHKRGRSQGGRPRQQRQE